MGGFGVPGSPPKYMHVDISIFLARYGKYGKPRLHVGSLCVKLQVPSVLTSSVNWTRCEVYHAKSTPMHRPVLYNKYKSQLMIKLMFNEVHNAVSEVESNAAGGNSSSIHCKFTYLQEGSAQRTVISALRKQSQPLCSCASWMENRSYDLT